MVTLTIDGTSYQYPSSGDNDWASIATLAMQALSNAAIYNIVEDTTPQLGGDLDTNGNDIYPASAASGVDVTIKGGDATSGSGGFVVLDQSTGTVFPGGIKTPNLPTSSGSGTFNDQLYSVDGVLQVRQASNNYNMSQKKTDFTPVLTAGSATISNDVVDFAYFQQLGQQVYYKFQISFDLSGTPPSALIVTLPGLPTINQTTGCVGGSGFVSSFGVYYNTICIYVASPSQRIEVRRESGASWAAGTGQDISIEGLLLL